MIIEIIHYIFKFFLIVEKYAALLEKSSINSTVTGCTSILLAAAEPALNQPTTGKVKLAIFMKLALFLVCS